MAKIKKVVVDGVEYELGGSGSGGGGFKTLTIDYEAMEESGYPFMEYGEDFTADNVKEMEDGEIFVVSLLQYGVGTPVLCQFSNNEDMLAMIEEQLSSYTEELGFELTPIGFGATYSSSPIVLCEEGITLFG